MQGVGGDFQDAAFAQIDDGPPHQERQRSLGEPIETHIAHPVSRPVHLHEVSVRRERLQPLSTAKEDAQRRGLVVQQGDMKCVVAVVGIDYAHTRAAAAVTTTPVSSRSPASRNAEWARSSAAFWLPKKLLTSRCTPAGSVRKERLRSNRL